jgi:hypothetical protein
MTIIHYLLSYMKIINNLTKRGNYEKIMMLGMFCLINSAFGGDNYCYPQQGRHILKVRTNEKIIYDFIEIASCADGLTGRREIVGSFQDEYNATVKLSGTFQILLWSGIAGAHLQSKMFRYGNLIDINIDLESGKLFEKASTTGKITDLKGELIGYIESMELMEGEEK